LAGRDDDLAAFDSLIARARDGRVGSPPVLLGLRGVGKTVLLRAFREHAERADWLTMWIEGEPGGLGPSRAAARLARELEGVSRRVRRRGKSSRSAGALGAIESFSVNAALTGGGVSVSTRAPQADPFDLEFGLLDVVEALAQGLVRDAVGAALFVDEFQDLDLAATSALVAVQHAASQNGWPFYIIGAGLPTLPSRLAGVRSYTERYAYRTIDRLSDAQALEALAGPARRLGVAFEDDAAARLVAEAGGYPFYLQTFGYEAWLLGTDGRITAANAEEAVARGHGALDGFFRARWDRATAAERDALRLIAQDAPAASRVADLAERLGKPVGALGAVRRSLIAKGLVYAPARGQLALTALGMAAFIEREDGRDA
jgi:hypothetical protein